MKFLISVCLIYISFAELTSASEWKDMSAHNVQFVESAGGIKLEVLDWGGSGNETLVLLTGLALNAHTYDNFASYFTNDYRVVGITRIGHGNSETPRTDFSTGRLTKDIVAVLEELNIESAVFLGHSFAGSELTSLARNHPEKVKALIYVDAVQALEYLPEVQEKCPDVGKASIDIFKFQDSFYNTQRIQDENGNFLPFADLDALDKLIEQEETRDYKGVEAPAISINHLPKETIDLLLGVGSPKQSCLEVLNKMNYLGVAKFIQEKPNADVASIQHSQHMIHMVTPEELVKIIKNWLARTFVDTE
jgi:pimeloyl-ACP methyl ester carboxylesterase